MWVGCYRLNHVLGPERGLALVRKTWIFWHGVFINANIKNRHKLVFVTIIIRVTSKLLGIARIVFMF
jgi:hypothetical protein